MKDEELLAIRQKLYEIDKKSGWLDDDTLEEYIASVEYEIDISSEE